jgi:hypothetical protein
MDKLLRAGLPRYIICEVAERAGGQNPQNLVERLARVGFRAMELNTDGDLKPLTLRTDVLDVQDVVFEGPGVGQYVAA